MAEAQARGGTSAAFFARHLGGDGDHRPVICEPILVAMRHRRIRGLAIAYLRVIFLALPCCTGMRS